MPASAAAWWRPFKTVETAKVVYVDLSEDATHEAAISGWLSGCEQERCQRFLFDGPRRRFALCRAALRAILCSWLGCENEQLTFETSEHGKPIALVDGVAAPVSFNVSHSGEHGLIAIAPEGRLGVDVEERVAHRNMDLLIDGVFGPSEQAELALTRGYDKTHLFFRLWTIKEALIKALGTGFALDPSTFEVPSEMFIGEMKFAMKLPPAPEVTWQVEDLGNERFAAAIAQEGSSGACKESRVA
jgi:4'-phosphopantetheinyl transferase